MANVRQLKDHGAPIFPITHVSLVKGMEYRALMDATYAWDGTGTPDVSKIPAGVVVTYNGTDYTGTLVASASTTGRFYLVPSTTVQGEWDRYMTDGTGSSYAWKAAGNTSIPSPAVVDNETTDDPTKPHSAAGGKRLKDQLGELEHKVSEVVLPTIEGKTITLNGTIGATINLTPRTESGWRCVLQNCVAGDSFTITGKGGIGTRLWGFVDSNNILIAVSGSSITGTNLQVIAPAGAAYFVSNSSTTPLTVVFRGKDSLPDIIDKVDEILEEYTYDAVGGVWSVGRCVISDQVIYPSYTAYRYHIFDASAGDIISYKGNADSNTSILAKQDADGIHYTNIVAGTGSSISGEYTVTESGKYVICGYNNYATSAIITTEGRLVTVEEEIDALNATIEEQEERISGLEENYTVIDLSTEISGATNERYISYPGGVITVGPSGYCYTSPINVKKGDLIILYSDSTDLLSAISTCDSSGSSISPVVQGRPHGSYSKYEYIVTQNGYVILSFYGKSTAKAEISRNNALSVLADNPFAIEGSSHLLAITDNPLGFIKETPGFASAFESWGFIGDSLASGEIWGWLNVQKSLVGAKFDKMVDSTGNIVDASGYIISEPLQGQTYKPKFVVEFADSTGLSSSMCVIAKCDASGNILAVGAVGGSAIKYMFSVSDNQYVVICYPSGNIPSVRCVSNFVQDNYNISWGQYMCRNCGSVGVNYSVGGGTAKKFVLGQSPFNSTNSLAKLKSDTQKQAYIIAFGVNDKNDAMYDANVTDIEDIGADVNLADPSQNANTFAGYYARAIQEIKDTFHDSFIFLVTIPESSGYDEINTIIRAMPGIFEGTYNSIYVLDLKEYLPSSVLSQFRMNGVHFNAQGYEYFASVFCTYIDWLFRTHSSEFKGVSLIGKALLNNPS